MIGKISLFVILCCIWDIKRMNKLSLTSHAYKRQIWDEGPKHVGWSASNSSFFFTLTLHMTCWTCFQIYRWWFWHSINPLLGLQPLRYSSSTYRTTNTQSYIIYRLFSKTTWSLKKIDSHVKLATVTTLVAKLQIDTVLRATQA